jgi:hypothetical protein
LLFTQFWVLKTWPSGRKMILFCLMMSSRDIWFYSLICSKNKLQRKWVGNTLGSKWKWELWALESIQKQWLMPINYHEIIMKLYDIVSCSMCLQGSYIDLWVLCKIPCDLGMRLKSYLCARKDIFQMECILLFESLHTFHMESISSSNIRYIREPKGILGLCNLPPQLVT